MQIFDHDAHEERASRHKNFTTEVKKMIDHKTAIETLHRNDRIKTASTADEIKLATEIIADTKPGNFRAASVDRKRTTETASSPPKGHDLDSISRYARQSDAA